MESNIFIFVSRKLLTPSRVSIWCWLLVVVGVACIGIHVYPGEMEKWFVGGYILVDFAVCLVSGMGFLDFWTFHLAIIDVQAVLHPYNNTTSSDVTVMFCANKVVRFGLFGHNQSNRNK